ncbi:protein containing DUF820 [Candidatus Moduliflexus flocculans]|uniref:Protein containing DUF820 n=1 Tax=Candidatus Moduliflexus flocculans TaxID=1499966 RepID=A0A0S6VQ18_9BACT|nr:protein containing DUF820 [Candidatus Moduliflexus flocculans]
MSPSYYHSYICTNVASALKSEGTYSVFTELTLVIEGKDYIPDVSLYPKRAVMLGKRDIVKMTEMPLTAIEIVSPSQTMDDALTKFDIYFRAGVKSCWLVSPVTMTVNVYTDMEHVQIFHAGELIEPVLNIRIPLTAIFE